MTFPLYMLGVFDIAVAMILSVIVGMMFGFVLERAGFGRSNILVSQFYGDDMRVLKVMFTGIATATSFLGIFIAIGVLDASLLWVGDTYWGAYALGGLLLGIGFVMSGYCPGTAVVAIASGKLDAIFAIIGMMAGAVFFAIIYDPIESFYLSGHQGRLILTDWLGLSWQVIAFAVTIIAVISFVGGEWVERKVAAKHGHEPAKSDPKLRKAIWTGMVVLGVITLVTSFVVSPMTVEEPAIDFKKIAAFDLAQELIEHPTDYYIVDLRSNADCEKKRVLTAMCLPADDQEAKFVADLAPTRTLVLYAKGDVTAIPATAKSYGATVVTLAGGYDAFVSDVLSAPKPPESPTPASIERYKLASSIHGFFTGAKTAKAVMMKPKTVKRAVSKGGGC